MASIVLSKVAWSSDGAHLLAGGVWQSFQGQREMSACDF